MERWQEEVLVFTARYLKKYLGDRDSNIIDHEETAEKSIVKIHKEVWMEGGKQVDNKSGRISTADQTGTSIRLSVTPFSCSINRPTYFSPRTVLMYRIL